MYADTTERKTKLESCVLENIRKDEQWMTGHLRPLILNIAVSSGVLHLRGQF